MANNIIKRTWNQNRMVNIEDLSGMAFQSESGGHTFEVSGVDDSGTAVSLSGTVAATFLRADNAAISLSGTISNGKASVTLSADCYTVPGRFLLTVFVTSGGQKVGVYAATGSVTCTTGTATGSVPPLVTDSIQTGRITASGNVTVGGTLDVTNRRCYANLSSPGWYRVCRFDAGTAYEMLGADGTILDLFVSRAYYLTDNEVHKVSLLRTYNNCKFVGEESVSNAFGIDKVRLTAYDGGAGARYAYIDIHYTLSVENPVGFFFDARSVYNGTDHTNKWFTESFTSVADSPSGETVVQEFSFVATTGKPILFTPTAGSVYAGYGGCWYAKINGTVFVHVGVNGLTPGSSQTVFNLPENYRPITLSKGTGSSGLSYTGLARITVEVGGAVKIVSDDEYAACDICFIAA